LTNLSLTMNVRLDVLKKLMFLLINSSRFNVWVLNLT
jgi:hypothetical protein